MHMNAVWQSIYVCAGKNCCTLLTFTENFASLVWLYDFDKRTFCNCALWMTHCLGCPEPSPRSSPLCTSLVKTLCKFHRCSKSMRNIALCMHCERWISVPLWRNYKMIWKFGNFATLDFWKRCDAAVSQTTSGRLLLETESLPWNVTKVHNCSLCEPWWSWWDFAMTFDVL